MLVLTGPQGIGKSTLIHTLGREWFSDSLSTVSGKEAYEQLQGVWLVEMGELTATKKAEIEAVKMFLSKSEDVYRAAYGRRTNRYKRQCIFFGTSNDREFLRDKTGDRRSWPVDCHVQLPMKDIFEDLPGEVDQIWAEAVKLYKAGHPLILDEETAKEAIEKQKEHSEESPKTGMIIEYLDRLYPNNWEDMDLYERRAWLSGNDDFDTVAEKVEMVKDKTCVMEIWCELFRGEIKQLTPLLSREINDILRGLDGWEKVNKRMRFGKIYGIQRGFRREQD
jgi:DNA polymerase III delta prime subunit